MSEPKLTTDQYLTAEIKLYYDLYVPPDAGEKAPLLIAVHGYGAHKRHMMREARQVAPENFVIASIQGPHQHFRPAKDGKGYRVGFGWLTDQYSDEYVSLHHYFIISLIEKLSSEGTIDISRIFLYGFSQACALNFRYAFTFPNVLKGIIAICGGIPGDLETNPKYSPFAADTLYLYGDDDEFYTNEKFARFDHQLASKLPNYHSRQFEAKHEITDEMRDEIKGFLDEKSGVLTV